MTDRFFELEKRVERLEEAVRGLEQRFGPLDSETPPVTEGLPALREAGRAAGTLSSMVALTGRACLVLGGAFLIRAATEAGALSRAAGAAAGLAYAGIWLFFSDRDGTRGRASSAAFHVFTAAGIAYPLLWEACTRFGLLSPSGAVGAVAATTAILLALSLRQPIEALVWAATLGAVSTLFALIVSTGAIAPAAGALTLLAGATIWIAYGRRWTGPRWPAAIGADVAVLAMTIIASRPGAAEEGRNLSFWTAVLLALALPLLCVASFAVRTLVRRRPVTPFEILQSTASLLIGFGGAMSVAHTSGFGASALGVSTLAVGLAAYVVAFAFVERRAGLGTNFHFYASLGLLMMLVGGAFWMSFSSLSFLWSSLAVGASILGVRFHRQTLRWHSAAYVLAAAGVSGLALAAGHAFAGSPARGWSGSNAPFLSTLAACAAAYGILAASREAGPDWRHGLPGLLIAIPTVAGIGAVAIRILAGSGSEDAGWLAAIRTGVLAGSAIAAALLGRCHRTRELSWLVYPLLALGGIKLLIEDVPKGRPATLFVGFALFGAALLIAPRVLRSGHTSSDAPR